MSRFQIKPDAVRQASQIMRTSSETLGNCAKDIEAVKSELNASLAPLLPALDAVAVQTVNNSKSVKGLADVLERIIALIIEAELKILEKILGTDDEYTDGSEGGDEGNSDPTPAPTPNPDPADDTEGQDDPTPTPTPTPAPGPDPSTGDGGALTQEQRDTICQRARDIVNSGEYEYEYGGTGGDMDGNGIKDFDCSGFVGHLYGEAGINLPRSAKGIYDAAAAGNGLELINESQLQPGDIVLTSESGGPGGIGHAMIFLGYENGVPMVAEAASEKTGMTIRPMYDSWRKDYGFYFVRAK